MRGGTWRCVGETVEIDGVEHVGLVVWTVEVHPIPASEGLISKQDLHFGANHGSCLRRKVVCYKDTRWAGFGGKVSHLWTPVQKRL